MVEGAALGYGLVSMFVLSSAERNRKTSRSHSKPLLYVGWALMGTSFATSALLIATVARAAMAA